MLLYGSNTWMLTKHIKKKLDGNCTRMLQAVLNKSWRQHTTKQLLYRHLPPILKTIQITWTRHAGYCWRSKEKLISDVLQWTPSHGWGRVGRPTRTYLQQLCTDTVYNMEDLLRVMDDRDECWKRVQEIPACGIPWWWWYICVCACVCVCVMKFEIKL